MALQDYTTYTEVDPNNHITVANNLLTWTLDGTSEEAYVYKDFGSSFFSDNYTHQLETREDTAGTSASGIWGLANVIDDFRGILNFSPGHLLFWVSGTLLRIFESVIGNQYFDTSIALSNATLYYLTLDRDETIGSFGQLQVKIYSDSLRTTLVDTLTVSLHEKADFQYLYALAAFNGGGGTSRTGIVQNLELIVDEIGWIPFFFDAGHY